MKIVLHSNAPTTPTGYGVQSNLMVPRLRSLGHQIIFAGFYGVQGAPLMMDDLLILPTSKDAYGNDVILDDYREHQADITITLIDAWIFNAQMVSQMRWVPYFPVDADPLPPMVTAILRHAYRIIAYSKFGVEKAKEAGFADVLYAPHMVDTAFYEPMDKVAARKALGMPDDRMDWFLASIVAANKGHPSRKAFDQQIRAFAEFHRAHPQTALAIHSDVWGGYDGENIPRIAQMAGLPQDAVYFPPKYQFQRGMLGPDYLRKLYNASDVFMNVTRGEGFGVPIVEAMACGVPAIVTDFSAMPELVDAGAGWKVPYVDKFYYQDAYQVTPSVKGIVEALEAAYTTRESGELAKMGERARAGMVAEYDANHVAQTYWKPILSEIAAGLEKAKARTAERAARRAENRAKLNAGGAVEQPQMGGQGPVVTEAAKDTPNGGSQRIMLDAVPVPLPPEPTVTAHVDALVKVLANAK